jgi:outer membrane biosynthesis protein TonB
MEVQIFQHKEERDKRLSAIVSLLLHLLLFFILLLPFLRFPVPPPGQEGILVTFGEEDKGGNNSSQTNDTSEELNSTKPTKTEEQKETAKSKTDADLKATAISEEESPVKANKEVKKETKSPEKTEAEIRREKEALAAAKKAQEEARKKAEYDKAKEEFGDLFGEGNGKEPGKQGDPSGDPNADALEGISTGSGRVGGGLSNRGLLFEPDFEDNSQKEGKVVIKICVDTQGQVVSAKFTQRGSTTTDAELVKIALDNSKKYVFSKSDIEEQCGTITVEFKLI